MLQPQSLRPRPIKPQESAASRRWRHDKSSILSGPQSLPLVFSGISDVATAPDTSNIPQNYRGSNLGIPIRISFQLLLASP